MSAEQTDTVKVLEKALIVLDAVRASNKPVGVNEIAKQTSVKVATAFRLLQTLKAYGWVFQDSANKYVVGPKISFVTDKNNFYVALKEVSYYVMRRLSDQETQAMNLVVRENEKCFILQQTRTGKMIDYVPPVGSELPIHASASGKVLLAGQSPAALDRILDVTVLRPFTEHTITDRERLTKQLEEIRARGYALDEYESVENGFCIAVPIREPGGQTIAALSFSGLVGRFDRKLLPRYHRVLAQAAQEISEQLFADRLQND